MTGTTTGAVGDGPGRENWFGIAIDSGSAAEDGTDAERGTP
jgi:hypothetical protein